MGPYSPILNPVETIWSKMKAANESPSSETSQSWWTAVGIHRRIDRWCHDTNYCRGHCGCMLKVIFSACSTWRIWMSVHKFVNVGILLLKGSWFRLFCNNYLFRVVICHICVFISNRTRTFEIHDCVLFWITFGTIWNSFGYFWNSFELSEIHLDIAKFDLNYLKSLWIFLNLTWKRYSANRHRTDTTIISTGLKFQQYFNLF